MGMTDSCVAGSHELFKRGWRGQGRGVLSENADSGGKNSKGKIFPTSWPVGNAAIEFLLWEIKFILGKHCAELV